MAQIFPKVNAGSNHNWAEDRIVKALENQLDPDVVIYPNVHMVRWNSSGDYRAANHLKPHEADIVVVDPKRGILLIEVKGASVDFDSKTGNWGYRSGQSFEPCPHPFGQACKNLKTLTSKLLQGPLKGYHSIPFPYGFAIAFPTKQIDPPFPLWYDPAFVFKADDLSHLGNRVESCLDAWSNRKQPHGIPQASLELIADLIRSAPTQSNISPEKAAQIHSLLRGETHLREAEFWDIEQSHKRIEELTEDQAVILDMLSESPRLEIRGPAGSGKTMVAFLQAKRLSDQGKNVLFLCYNSMLAEDLKERVRSLKNVEVTGIYELVNRLARLAGIPPMQEADPGYWEELPGNILENSLFELELAGKKPLYDALVVDEGQDFHSTWWSALEELIRPNEQKIKPLVLFHDPLQNLFRTNEVKQGTWQLPGNLLPVQLNYNCRNTKKIAAYLSNLVNDKIIPHKNAEDGTDPVIVRLKTKSDGLNDDAAKQIEEWINQGFELKDMAILKPFRYDQEKMIIKRRNGQGIPLVKSLKEWRQGKGVLLHTVRGFKGMEANALLLYNLPKVGTTKNYGLADHYVASSRARLHLTMMVQPGF